MLSGGFPKYCLLIAWCAVLDKGFFKRNAEIRIGHYRGTFLFRLAILTHIQYEISSLVFELLLLAKRDFCQMGDQ